MDSRQWLAAGRVDLEALRPFVVRYCRARVGRRGSSFSVADAVAREVCADVVETWPEVRGQGRSFLSFVYGTAVRRVAAVPGAGSGVPAAELVALLPAQQREILLLRVTVGLSAEETADAIGTTPGAVRVAQHRALNELRRRLKGRPDRERV